MITKTNKIVSIILIIAIFLTSIVSIVSANESNQGHMIRVGLLFDQAAYLEAVPYVTLSSPNGLDIQFSDKTSTALSVFPHEEIIFNLDQFYLIVDAVDDIKRAEDIFNNLKNKNYKAVIIEENLSGTIKYQVIVGYYQSTQDAQIIADKIKQDCNYNVTIQGKYRIQAGAFEDKSLAEALMLELTNKGYQTYVVTCSENSNLLYKVWIGNLLSSEGRKELLKKLQAEFPEQEFVEDPQCENYIIPKIAIVNGKAIQVMTIPTNSSKIIVKGIKGSNVPIVKVNERSNRYYRGVIELSTHNNKLAVINEVLLEEYLYGVVAREMGTGWPIEALKAQAVIARTYAIGRNGWVIADVVDDTKDQAYWGYSIEASDTNSAVDITKGEVIRTKDNKLAQTYYSSNAGGISAEGKEVWGNTVSYLQSVDSHFDSAILERTSKWYHIMLADGRTGYIHSNYVVKTNETNKVGFEKAKIEGANVNVRTNADIYHDSFAKVNTGDAIIILDEVYENNAYSWSKGPYNATKMREMLNKNQRPANPSIAGPVLSLEVVKRGISGRVIEVQANNKSVSVSSPDAHRSLFSDGSSLRSTLFEIDNRGSYTILGAGNQVVEYPQKDERIKLYAVSASNNNANKPNEVNNDSNDFIIINKSGDYRVATKQQEFVFNGKGYGHGFGLSQWGAYGMAMQLDNAGNIIYNYKDILHHYYSNDVKITKVE